MTAGPAFDALGDPVRRRILELLGDGERPAGVVAHALHELFGISQPATSQHLRVLRGAGVVRGARRGREIAYSLVDDHVAHIVADAVSHAREARS